MSEYDRQRDIEREGQRATIVQFPSPIGAGTLSIEVGKADLSGLQAHQKPTSYVMGTEDIYRRLDDLLGQVNKLKIRLAMVEAMLGPKK
jgi:hypothetical protein